MENKPDLNSASREQLSAINGIGDSLANRIVNFREEHGKFKSFDELKEASGIGDAVIDKLKDTTELK
jgi:competence protein ComEA